MTAIPSTSTTPSGPLAALENESANTLDGIFSDLDPQLQALQDKMKGPQAKARAIGNAADILSSYRNLDGNKDATIEEFLNDENVPREEKEAVVLALVIGNDPAASTEDIDAKVATIMGELDDPANTDRETLNSIADSSNDLLGDEGLGTRIADTPSKFIELADKQSKLALDENILSQLKELQTFMTALTDMWTSILNTAKQAFAKAST